MTDAATIAKAVHQAAVEWCGEKDRETSFDDIRYFEHNWRSFPGFESRVRAILAQETDA